MKKLIPMTATAVVAFFATVGCQTRITATKYPESAAPYTTTTADGTTSTNGYQVLSGGWNVTARSPLWADEAIKGLDVGTNADGSVYLKTESYTRDLSTNAVVMAHNLVQDAATLAAKVGAAIATAGGNVATDTTSGAISTLVNKFISAGGDASKATVTCTDGNCSITDGSVTCTDGSCSIN